MLRRDSVEHAERVYSSVRWNDEPYKEHYEVLQSKIAAQEI